MKYGLITIGYRHLFFFEQISHKNLTPYYKEFLVIVVKYKVLGKKRRHFMAGGGFGNLSFKQPVSS